MDLQTPRRTRRLNLNYEGPARSASQILYTPIKITQFEITESWLHPGKECLALKIASEICIFTNGNIRVETVKED